MTTITTVIDPPLPTDTPAVFNTKAFEAWGDINTWATQANTVAGEVNTNAATATTKAGEALTSANNAATSETNAGTSATTSQNWATSLTAVSGGLYGARYYAQVAQSAVASLPPGTINDSITTGTDTWSSSKISTEIGASQSSLNFFLGAI